MIENRNSKSEVPFLSMKLSLIDKTGVVNVSVIGTENQVRCILIKQNCICEMLVH